MLSGAISVDSEKGPGAASPVVVTLKRCEEQLFRPGRLNIHGMKVALVDGDGIATL